MTLEEFVGWKDDVATRFPDVGTWMDQHPSTMKVWFAEVFRPLFVEHCLEANKRLLATKFDRFDRERLPALILKLAADVRGEQSTAARQKQIELERAQERERKERRKDYKSVIPGSLWEKVELMGVWVEGFKVEFGRAPDRYERNKWLDENVD